mmetsp:Transcript_2110/g.4782  ORF Transcript_2110/g.4782 Transcript_2110/m.4782 type:complete len:207 (-) Transcript_2110:790-1410(-)
MRKGNLNCHKHSGHCGCSTKANVAWQRDKQVRESIHLSSKAALSKTKHRLTHTEASTSLGANNNSRTVSSRQPRVTGVHIQNIQDITEVQPNRMHLEHHVHGGVGERLKRLQGQTAERPSWIWNKLHVCLSQMGPACQQCRHKKHASTQGLALHIRIRAAHQQRIQQQRSFTNAIAWVFNRCVHSTTGQVLTLLGHRAHQAPQVAL